MADKKRIISSVNQALEEWEKSLEEKHEEEMDQLMKQMMRQKEKEMNKLVETSQRIIAKEIKEKQNLEMQVRMLREGWNKEREEWQAKRQAISKDLDPNAGLFDFMTCM